MIPAVGVGVGGLGGDAAHVVLVPGDPDVSLLPPARAPAVLHLPVVLAVLRAVAHHQHRVVHSVGVAVRRGVDSRVRDPLEAVVACVNCNRYRL